VRWKKNKKKSGEKKFCWAAKNKALLLFFVAEWGLKKKCKCALFVGWVSFSNVLIFYIIIFLFIIQVLAKLFGLLIKRR
jgi:hypothetical protein